jgi:hypothetical protein
MKRRLSTRVALAALAAVMLVPGAQAMLPTKEPAPNEEYAPFVTDFPKPVVSTAGAGPFVPFATDFPKPASVAATTPSRASGSNASGIDWGAVGIGSGFGAAFAGLLAGSWLFLTRRARPTPC